jgi:DNA-binding transcriptional LysR family regulator
VRLIRVVLAELPDELRAIVQQSIAAEPDLVVVADVADEVSVLLEARRADVVIVSMRDAELPAIAERLVDEYARIGVLAVDPEHEQGLLYQLRPKLVAIDAVNPGSLVAAVRQAAELAA